MSSFRKIDTNHDGFISENEFIAHVLSSNQLIGNVYDLDRFDPVAQVDTLLGEVTRLRREYETMSAGGADVTMVRRENERLVTENSTLRKSNEELREKMNFQLESHNLQGAKMETDLERMQSLLTEMELVQGIIIYAASLNTKLC